MTDTAPAGWYPDPENPTQQRYWDGAAWTQNVAPTSNPGDAPQVLVSQDTATQRVEDAPVLHTWKTSVGFSVLGLFVGFPLLMILSALVAIVPMALTGLVSTQRGSGGPELVGLVGNIFLFAYAVAIYPWYFSEKPRLRSSKAISFANLMFGGFIFGLLWNSNLTKKTKGISYIVSAVGSGLMCLSLAFGILGALLSGAAPNSTSTSGSTSSLSTAPTSTIEAAQPLERTTGVRVYTDARTGASFVIPETWSEVPFTSEQNRAGRDAKFRVPEPGGTAFYSSLDQWSNIPEANRQGASRESVDMHYLSDADVYSLVGGSSSNATVQRITLNGVEYFLTRATDKNGAYNVNLLHIESGYVYDYQYVDLGDIDDKALQTFYSMVASTIYP